MWQDLRFALRMLVKHRTVTAVAVVALALGIGANTAVFSIVDAYLLKPLPFAEPDRLVVALDVQGLETDNPSSFPEFQDLREQAGSFDGVAALFNRGANLSGSKEPQRIQCSQISDGFFATLGVSPELGRGLGADDHKKGAAPVALLSHGFWERNFGANAGIVGSPVLLDGVAYTVVGVMPPAASSFSIAPADVWTPLEPALPWEDRGTHFLNVVARLKPGIEIGSAQREVDAVASRTGGDRPGAHGIKLFPLQEIVAGSTREPLLLVFAAGAFMLTIALANVANLLLSRTTGRSRELAIRAALGASRGRVTRLLLTESVLLSVIGGIAGAVLALWAKDAIVAYWPTTLRRPEYLSLDWRAFAFTAFVALGAGVLSGLPFALRAGRGSLATTLKDSGSNSTANRASHRLRGAIVGGEIALATILVLGAGLMLQTYWRVARLDPGFRPENAISLKVSLPEARYPDAERRAAFFHEVIERIGALPGVDSVGAVNNLPLSGGGTSGDFAPEGIDVPQGEEPMTEKYVVSPGYFQAMGIPIREGRLFTDADSNDAAPVVVVAESIARRYWPDGSAVGRRLTWNGGERWMTIVGVVGDVKHDQVDRPAPLESYVPYAQSPWSIMTVVVRTSGDPSVLVAPAKREIAAVDPDQPVYRIATLDRVVSDSIGSRRLPAFLLGTFALISLVLSIVGVYAVMADSTAQRTKEFGVRIALGATPADLLRLVLSQAVTIVLGGIAIGLVGAMALLQLISGLLFGVDAFDPTTYVLAPAILAIVALVASYVPARRAMKVDPITALRWE